MDETTLFRYICGMPRQAEQEPGPWSRAVAAAIKRVIDDRGMSIRELAQSTEKSSNYLAVRFRGEASFTLNDIDDLSIVLGFDAGEFLASVNVNRGEVIQLRPDVSGYLDDALHGIDTAAGTDETQADED
jgi:transcriptional regulator with XRE-family HTH domain